MSNQDMKNKALQLLKGNWGSSVVIMICLFFFNTVLTSLLDIIYSGGVDNWLDEEKSSSSIGSAISLLLVPLSVGIFWYYLDLARNTVQPVSYVFHIYGNGQQTLKIILTSFVQGIYVLFWTLLFIVPGIVKAIAYSQTFFILKDNPDMGINEAITRSREIMHGRKWQFVFLNISFIGWAFLSLLTFGIGFLWLTPYLYTSYALFYEEVSSNVLYEK